MHTRTLALRGLVGVVGIALVVVAGVVIHTAGHNQPVALDAPWHELLAGARYPALEQIALVLNAVGGTLSMTLVTAAIVILLLVLRRWRAAISIGFTVAVGSGICSLIKIAVSRPRPADGVVDILSDSYPSGHTTTAACLAIAIALAFPRAWTRVLAAGWITVMALSRNYLLVHWLSDVVAAAVLGLSVALLVSAVVGEVANSRTWRTRILKEPSLEAPPLPG